MESGATLAAGAGRDGCRRRNGGSAGRLAVQETLYKALGVNETATTAEIKAAYRQLAKEYHPDEIPEEFRNRPLGKLAEEAFRNIDQAYKTLSDPQRRCLYDEQLRIARKPKLPSAPPFRSPERPSASQSRSSMKNKRKNWARLAVGIAGLFCLLAGLILLFASIDSLR
jgi:curved DNA-binding protein CbpA